MYVRMPTKDCRVKCRKLTCLCQINVQARLLWAQHPAVHNYLDKNEYCTSFPLSQLHGNHCPLPLAVGCHMTCFSTACHRHSLPNMQTRTTNQTKRHLGLHQSQEQNSNPLTNQKCCLDFHQSQSVTVY